MFTGIIEEIGTLKSLQHLTDTCRITIGASKVLEGLQLGDSIATNGICLTVTSFDANSYTADVMPETLRLTNLADLHTNDKVNLERAMAVGGRLGGHIVSGHVDGTGIIIHKYQERNAILVNIAAEPEVLDLIVKKGSITIDGISLTVTDVDDKSFWVSIVNHTQSHTTLTSKGVGQKVNLENDILAKYVQKMMGKPSKMSDSALLELLK